MANPKQEQIELAERLQTSLLEQFEHLLKSGDMSPTDRATLARLLMQNGWNLDPSALPRGLADKLTTPRPTFEEDDEPPSLRAVR